MVRTYVSCGRYALASRFECGLKSLRNTTAATRTEYIRNSCKKYDVQHRSSIEVRKKSKTCIRLPIVLVRNFRFMQF